jgi:hypothetical protein
VIDLGCLPATPFPHLKRRSAPAVERLQGQRADSFDTDELMRAGRGRRLPLSLREDTLWVADEVDSTRRSSFRRAKGLASLERAAALERRGRRPPTRSST